MCLLPLFTTANTRISFSFEIVREDAISVIKNRQFGRRVNSSRTADVYRLVLGIATDTLIKCALESVLFPLSNARFEQCLLIN